MIGNNDSFENWCEHLKNQKPGVHLGLERIKKVATNMQLIPCSCPVITIGGTNGKGSTLLTIEHMLVKSGYRTVSFMSPCVVSPTEQFRVDQKPVTEKQLITLWKKIVNAQHETALTVFEYKTLTALLLAKEVRPDLLLLEVGLGGRDDATNIVDADVAVITQIGSDHEKELGSCPLQRGLIKAGIFKNNKIAIVGQSTPPKTVINMAQTTNSKLIICPQKPPQSNHPISLSYPILIYPF